jgi:hypothetical protein
MVGKIARIEELLGDTITEGILYRTPSGALFNTKEEAMLLSHVLMVTVKSVKSISNKDCAARTVR